MPSCRSVTSDYWTYSNHAVTTIGGALPVVARTARSGLLPCSSLFTTLGNAIATKNSIDSFSEILCPSHVGQSYRYLVAIC